MSFEYNPELERVILLNAEGERWKAPFSILLVDPPLSSRLQIELALARCGFDYSVYSIDTSRAVATVHTNQHGLVDARQTEIPSPLEVFRTKRLRFASLISWNLDHVGVAPAHQNDQNNADRAVLECVQPLTEVEADLVGFLIPHSVFAVSKQGRRQSRRADEHPCGGTSYVCLDDIAGYSIFKRDVSEWERETLRSNERASRTTKLALYNFPAGPHKPRNVYSGYSSIEPIVFMGSNHDPSIPHLLGCQADLEFGCRALEDVIIDGVSGCVQNTSGDVLQDSVLHVLFYEGEIPTHYASQNTGWRLWSKKEPDVLVTIDEECFVAVNKFADNYYHWFHDIAPKIWIYLRSIETGSLDRRTPLYIPKIPKVGFQSEFLNAVDIPAENLRFLPKGFTRLKRAIFPQIRADIRYPVGQYRGRPRPREFYDWLRRSVRPLLDQDTARNKWIYISRSDTRKRVVRNEDDVIRFLERRGFSILRTGGATLRQQVSLISDAEIVVGPHGAGLMNFAFTPLDSTLIEVRNRSNADNGYRFLAQYRGSNYTYLPATEIKSEKRTNDFDMELDLSVLDQALTNVRIPS